MKKVLASSVMVLMVFFLSAGFGLAGNGQGSGTGGSGTGGGTGPIHDILSGDSFTYEGSVVSMALGGGIVIETADEEEVTIYGIGPDRYWESLGVDPLDVSDAIEVTGFVVDYNVDVVRNIAMKITVEGVEVQLRDPETGVPLWRGGSRNSN